ALCHGARGEGYAADRAPAIGNRDFLRVASDEFIHEAIAEGHPGTSMSAWHRRHGGPLDDPAIRAIVSFLRSLARDEVQATDRGRVYGDLARGAALFALHCAECHGKEGEGGSGPSLNSPVFLRTVSDRFVRDTIARGRRNTPMEGWDARLSSEEIDALTAFVRSLKPRAFDPPPAPTRKPPPLDAIVLNPEGPLADFEAREGLFVSGEEVKRALDQGKRFILIDARPPSDWAKGHIPGAVPFPFYDAEALIQYIKASELWVIAYCACPHGASGRVIDALHRAGHKRAAILDEGIFWWIEKGYPIEMGSLE
ncbi:MAG: c-type cytochrome, partial [Deltaproteobacteria bacterium]|nr:c-type cytochrome [Deltaproteobacteria bacterium]